MILYSRHARVQMLDRGISVQEVEDAIKMGSKEIQHPGKILHHYRYFTVVTKKKKEIFFIITVKPRWKP